MVEQVAALLETPLEPSVLLHVMVVPPEVVVVSCMVSAPAPAVSTVF
ncbi:hypothetical protein [Microbacterium testaceum]